MPWFLREANKGASHFWSTGRFSHKTVDNIGLLGFSCFIETKAHTKKTHAKIRKALQIGDIGKFKIAEFQLKNWAVVMVHQVNFLGKGVAFPKEKSYPNICM